jgi:hypothetical protein
MVEMTEFQKVVQRVALMVAWMEGKKVSQLERKKVEWRVSTKVVQTVGNLEHKTVEQREYYWVDLMVASSVVQWGSPLAAS